MDNDTAHNAVKAEDIVTTIAKIAKKGPPPVHLWNPPSCGDIDMEIRADGTWFYNGTPIGRVAMVRLFASILKREGDRYFLVTPVEKVGIRVQDAPFMAVDVSAQNGDLIFETNVGDTVHAGPNAPIRIDHAPDGTPRPYVMVRDGLEALIDRKTFYRLMDMAQPAQWQGREWFGLFSGGTFFPITALSEAAELDDPPRSGYVW